jgi:hypothetical protein
VVYNNPAAEMQQDRRIKCNASSLATDALNAVKQPFCGG